MGDSSPQRIGRPPKKPRKVDPVPLVVNALEQSDVLPADLRTVFTAALPIILNANKADRHAYENEVVAQAEEALAAVQADLEQKHAVALQNQNVLIAPAEHAKRSSDKEAAETACKAISEKLEANKETQFGARRAVHDAQSALKAAQKDAAASEKEMQALADKKTNLSELLEKEFKLVQETTTATPEGKEAVKKLSKVGKEFKFDETLLQTLPLTCKKELANRTEFEVIMFATLKTNIDRQIDGFTQKLAEMEPSKAEKLTAVASAQNVVEKAEAALAAASEVLSASAAGTKEATKEVAKANDHFYKIWGDMKEVCDLQDGLAREVKNFKESVITAFQQLKEREPEPEEPEPVEAEHVEEEKAAEAEEAEAAVEEAAH